MVGASRWGHLVVAVAVACTCGVLAPAASASLSVPTGGSPVPFTGSGTSGTSAAIASFEAAAGGGDNGTIAGEQPGGFRHVTWDQIALNGSDPGSTTIDSGHVIVPARSRLQPSGLELGPEIAVANDGFQSVGSSATFTPFSPANVWGPFNSPRHGRVRRRRAGRPGEHADARRRPGDSGSSCWRRRPIHPDRVLQRRRSRSARCPAPRARPQRGSAVCCSPTRSSRASS